MYVYTYLRIYLSIVLYYIIVSYRIILLYLILHWIILCRVASCGIILLYHITLYHVYAYTYIYIYGICIIHIIYNIYIYIWILLIVEISTPKPKSINFAKIKKKKLLNTYFHSRTLPKASWMLFERFLPLQNVRSVPNGKDYTGVLFSTPTPKISLFWDLEFKQIQYWEAPGIDALYSIYRISYFINKISCLL